MGLNRAQFFRLTPLDFARMSRAYHRKQERDWLKVREVMAMMVNTTPQENPKWVHGKDIIPLSFDTEAKPADEEPAALMDLGTEELERIIKLYNQ